MIGKALAHYEIESLLGRGGMGEVYRARDTRLDRLVAIKVLPEAVKEDPDRVARFQREAKVLASLNHPNIAALYGMEEFEGTLYLVMELVEGETLAERIARGPIPPAEALRIGYQIAEACEAAHEKGIIHRDLKPSNVKITPEGKIKVLDFGLAKAMEGAPSSVVLANSPTISLAATQAGVVLGTAAYMSPEQAKGLEASPRSDIFSFGCVLYEMHTGRQPFRGETVAEVMAHVIARDPDLSELPANLNPRVPELLRRCLEKDPRRRWHAVADTRVEIEVILADPRGVILDAQLISRRRPLWKRAIPVIAGLVAGAIGAGGAAWILRPQAAPVVTQFRFPLPDGQTFTESARPLLTISPDGTAFAYAANGRLYLKKQSEFKSTAIQGSELPGGGPRNPAFSPDGKWIALFSEADKTIKRIGVDGGTPVPISQAASVFGMNWGEDQNILFGGGSGGVMRVSAKGGRAEAIIRVEKNHEARNPQLLPGGAVLFALVSGEKTDIVAETPGRKDRQVIVEGGSDARYLPIGVLVYALAGDVLSQPFDAGRLMPTAGAAPLPESVYAAGKAGAAQISFSDTGSLVYVAKSPGQVTHGALAFVDRQGKITPLALPPGQYDTPRISPDGRQLVFSRLEGDRNIYVYNLFDKTSERKLTFAGPNNTWPIWSYDSKHIVFGSDRDGGFNNYSQRADGSGQAERLNMPGRGGQPSGWAPRDPVFLLAGARGQPDVWTYSIPRGMATRVISAPMRQRNAVFSPDGRWVLYESDESGKMEVYIQPYPPVPSVKFQVTRDGGHSPVWSPSNGKEVFFVKDGNLFSVAVETQPSPSFSMPVKLPITGFIQPEGVRQYDVTPDGKQFVMIVPPQQSTGDAGPPPQIQVVLNWFEELKQMAAEK
jgi:eukaryotic-like serine/threonine-protein kinase